MKKYLSLLAILLLLPTILWSQLPKFKMVADPEKTQVVKGEAFSIRLKIDLPAPWHTYPDFEQLSNEGIGPSPTEFSFKPNNFLKQNGKTKSSKPKEEYDKGFEFNIKLFEGKFDYTIPVVALQDIDFAKDKVQLLVYMQLCDTAKCLPSEDYITIITTDAWGDTDATASIEEITSENETLEAESPTSTADIKEAQEIVKTESQIEIEQKKSEGFLSFLLFAMGAGALALLTPCVFPMIPITVSFFTKRGEKGKSSTIKDAFVYALGIILTFTGLGILLAAIFGATGIRDFAANGWVNILIASVFIIFAFNLFGSFEIQLPTGLMNKLNKKSSEGTGIISVLLMALTFSITSFTCTVPFVGSTLIAASGGEWFWAVLGMIGFSGVFALPFFLLALFPSVMKKMPKAGGWMNNVKVVMGFIEIAAAMKFLSNADLVWNWGILPKEWFLAIWIAICIIVSLYILGVFRLHHDSEVKGVTASRIIFSVMFMAFAFYFISGLSGKTLGEIDAFLPPAEYRELMSVSESAPTTSNADIIPIKVNGNDELQWLSDYQQALKLSQETGKPLFIDFTGFTCTNCRWMEQNMFKREEISSRMNQFILVHLYTDRRSEPYLSNKKMQQEQYGSIELPLYVIIAPDGKHIGTKTFTRDTQEFIDFLNKGIATTVNK